MRIGPKIDAHTSCFFRKKRGVWDVLAYFPVATFKKYEYDENDESYVAYTKKFIQPQWLWMSEDFQRAFFAPAFAWKTGIIALGLWLNYRKELSDLTLVAVGAVTFDAFTGGTQTTTTSKTLAHTVGANKNSYIVGYPVLHAVSTDEVSGVTYDGETMAELAAEPTSGDQMGSKRIEAYGLAIGTGSGSSEDMVASLSNQSVSVDIQSFFDVSQSIVPDATGVDLNQSGGSASPFNYDITVSRANSLLAGCIAVFAGSYSAGTNTTVDGSPQGSRDVAHSSTVVGTGTQTLQWTKGSDDSNAGVIIAMPPPLISVDATDNATASGDITKSFTVGTGTNRILIVTTAGDNNKLIEVQ